MARQKGLIHFVGTLNGINFYFRKVVPVARKAGGGFNGSSIKRKPSMARIRENNSEFGTASSAKKLFKDSLLPFLGKTKDSILQGQLMQLFMKIKDCDAFSDRGKRNVSLGIESTESKKLLEEFNFTNLVLPYSNGYFDILTSTFTIINFEVKQLKFPKSASHLKLQLGIISLNFETKKSSLFVSYPTLITKKTSVESITLTVGAPEDLTNTRVALLYYSYAQELNDEFYDLKDKTAYGIKILKVY